MGASVWALSTAESQRRAVSNARPRRESEKNPLGDVELTDDDALKLQAIQKDVARVELALERRAQEKMVPAISKFWPVALMNHGMLALHAQHSSDQAALSYLEDLWIVRDPKESRCFTLEFGDDNADADGITETMLEFSWERDVQPQAMKIDWKDEAKNLTKLHPRVVDQDDDLPSEGGSFFNFFEVGDDPFDIGVTIANDVFPEAIDYFLGHAGGEDVDSDEEDDDSEDDENEDEIDLEKPRPKKQKKA
ncbi:hypothetical protein BC628DRAFT_1409387 [Trametes gibbosa]|nr:hypothetical protein BC628DRAFT_1411838 [Trametes gibbosa]KAI0828340.1 hypothetical protein BC628DRAFT_1409387 [Trametes gibbosa]